MLLEALDYSVTGDVSVSTLTTEAGLRYVKADDPGIRRKRRGDAFVYTDAEGRRITDEATLKRIRSLVLPPAWRDVWICKRADGHLQATGIDAKGRKQYRYHPRWRAIRDATKYNRMIAFGLALPAIRARVEHDLGLRGFPREKIIATIVRLLETTLIRVGNREYARDNASFGLTTLRNRHVTVEGDNVHFEFRAKSGKMRRLDLKDRRLARIMKGCRELPGQELFQYVDSDGARRSVASHDVNAYLKEAGGDDFTAKDFRTWAGTVLAALALQAFEAFDSDAAAKRNVARAIESVASRLGNTATICRKCYVHPEIPAAYLDGALTQELKGRIDDALDDSGAHLSPEETQVLTLLRRRLSAQSDNRDRR